MICLLAFLGLSFFAIPKNAEAHTEPLIITENIEAGPKPIKKIIRWARRFYRAYEIYDTVTGLTMSCGTAYNYATYYYGEYERLYSQACYYWGSNYGYTCYNQAINAYNLAVYYNNRLYDCQ
ncbi:hypothetical protein [Lewinella cohaerens]|uniref:hypothetical protein n=1 Tax=Lewinella cohaerens TaxID=70995 RepID=UPI0003755D83|nr:hypothetical protein [Lewinella cohaerens]